MKIEKYIVVTALNEYFLAESVNKKMEEGYTPIGGMTIVELKESEIIDQRVIRWYHQAMMLKKKAIKKLRNERDKV